MRICLNDTQQIDIRRFHTHTQARRRNHFKSDAVAVPEEICRSYRRIYSEISETCVMENAVSYTYKYPVTKLSKTMINKTLRISFKESLRIFKTMSKHLTQYKWKVLAWYCIGKDKKKWAHLESQWFDKKEDCKTDFNKMTEGYDVADCWGSEDYLLKRRIVPKKYRL